MENLSVMPFITIKEIIFLEDFIIESVTFNNNCLRLGTVREVRQT